MIVPQHQGPDRPPLQRASPRQVVILWRFPRYAHASRAKSLWQSNKFTIRPIDVLVICVISLINLQLLLTA
jgi:hypothetical protein